MANQQQDNAPADTRAHESAYEGRTDNPEPDKDPGWGIPPTGSGPTATVPATPDPVHSETAREGGGAPSERD